MSVLRLSVSQKIFAVVVMLGFLGTVGAGAQKDSYTPMPVEAGFGAMDTSAPAGPPQEIIQHFAAKESEFRHALDNYVYRRLVKVQTLDEGKVDGEYQQVDDVSFDSTGKRMEKVLFAPQNSLERVSMSPADFADIQQRLPFVLTSQDISQYNVTYVGKQKVDELQTYVFDVEPKVMEKNKRYFKGRIWVDQTDLQIVVTSGKNVPDDTRRGHEDLSPPFTTYREQIDGKYWFPTYTKAEGVLHFQGCKGCMSNDVHLRQVVKYTDYKQFKSTVKILYNGEDITNNGKPQDGKSPDAKPQDGKPQDGKPQDGKPAQPPAEGATATRPK